MCKKTVLLIITMIILSIPVQAGTTLRYNSAKCSSRIIYHPKHVAQIRRNQEISYYDNFRDEYEEYKKYKEYKKRRSSHSTVIYSAFPISVPNFGGNYRPKPAPVYTYTPTGVKPL